MEIRVRIVQDREFISSPFTFNVQEEMKKVLDFFKSELNIIFDLEVRRWDGGIHPSAPDFLQEELRKYGHGQEVVDIFRSLKAQGEKGDPSAGICIGFTGKIVYKGFAKDRGKIAFAFWDDEYSNILFILIGLCEIQEIPPANIIIHELLHLLGAFDIYDDRMSIMNNFPRYNCLYIDKDNRDAINEVIELIKKNS
ncbi:MAG: hypothetical protein PHW52_04540 [Candidatus Pacebacteria bacterium]|nr:hypothetical protein [Candidatus Paceibacterota bacterium]